MSYLKPCPFCGSEAEIVQLHPLHDSPVGVGCSNCPVIFAEYSDYKHFDTEAEAIVAWNTRPATTIGKVQVEIEPVLRGTLGIGTCEYCKDGTFNRQTVMISNHGWQRINYCPNCGARMKRREQ